jgi:hypothetical protein
VHCVAVRGAERLGQQPLAGLRVGMADRDAPLVELYTRRRGENCDRMPRAGRGWDARELSSWAVSFERAGANGGSPLRVNADLGMSMKGLGATASARLGPGGP